MKKLTILFISLLLISHVSYGQDFNFGLKGGLNLSTFSGDLDETEMRTGFHIGPFFQLKPTEKFALQPEVLFSLQGAGSGILDDNYNLSYINVPVLGRFYLVDGFSLDIGPQIGFLLNANFGDEDFQDAFQTIDFGIKGGLGLDLPMGFQLSARYYYGLGDIASDELEEITGFFGDEIAVNNQNIQVSVGYRF